MSNIEEYERFLEDYQEIVTRAKKFLDQYRNEFHKKSKEYEKFKNENNLRELMLAKNQYEKAQEVYKETIRKAELELYEFQRR